MTSSSTTKAKEPPALPEVLTEEPVLSRRYRPQIGLNKGGYVWCIVGKKSRKQLEEWDFPDSKEEDAKKRLALFDAKWAKRNERG